MKKFISISFFTWLFVMFSYPLFVEAAMPERKQLFDDNWRFKLGDTPDAPSLAYNDVGWRSLDLPHDRSVLFCRGFAGLACLPETMVAICLRVLDGTERSST